MGKASRPEVTLRRGVQELGGYPFLQELWEAGERPDLAFAPSRSRGLHTVGGRPRP